MDQERLSAIIECLLFAAGEPVSMARLSAVLDNVPREDIRRALTDLTSSYANAGRGIQLEQVAGGYQLRTAREHAFYVRKLLAARPPRLSRPMLETVAIIAYRQPITRPEIEQLRGVDSGAVLDTLLERRFVKIAGRKEAPGRPLIYATTPEFLEAFSLKDLESLPDISELREVESQLAAGLEAAESGSTQLELEPQLDPNPLSESPAEGPAAETSPSDEKESGESN